MEHDPLRGKIGQDEQDKIFILLILTYLPAKRIMSFYN
jgi:hypothetical protein